MILKYRTFENSEEFESFQKENDINILNVSPIAKDATIGEEKQTISFRIFVLYSENSK